MRVAVADVGTNSSHLLIAEAAQGDAGGFRVLDALKDRTRLGECLDGAGNLSPEGEDRLASALTRFRELASAAGVAEVHVYATSALREAPNGAEVAGRMLARTGVYPAIISGEREGELTYLGAAHAVELGEDNVLLDLGGGSLEFVRGDGQGPRDVLSLPLGGIRMTGAFIRSEPAYGGLVQSRTSPLSAAQALARLEPLRTWTARTGQPVYAFITLPREPDATNRERNLAVTRTLLDWARAGSFAQLHVSWDDALPGSPAPAEGAALAKDAPANVLVYPGADEVLSMLTARALAPQPATVTFEYSDPAAARQVIRYEGIPLTQSAVNHAQASGFTVQEAGRPADLTVFVFNGGDPRRAAMRVSQLLAAGPVAVADVEKVNLGNSRLWRDLQTLRRTANLKALAAWGTPGNNLGAALAHAKVALAPGTDPVRQDALLAREYANDVIYSADLRAALRKAIPEAQLTAPGTQDTLLNLARDAFPLRLGGTYTLQDATLPWGRSFEWDFTLTPQP
ncbi:DUF4127 family protein [Deinococcus sp. 23YEL01]|uniref:DUF4127 family protein n=1 Tax=Deinococcus sp. 23YEL01 TaxID=2745871 RepID=UPI001E3B6E4A|nr:DUF4127 family protein [Deinococcus sp. 23YEL01]MCD0171325.1 DUF4127 family protein [Deinococcus sp. 23YEL01]